MTLLRDVAEGVHAITRAHTNMYFIETGGRLLIVDAGLPAFWPEITAAVSDLGYGRDSIAGLLLTHGHFDHVGCAQRLRAEWQVPVYVARGDQHLAAHPYSYRHERNRPGYLLSHPSGLPTIAAMTMAGALTVKGAIDTTPFPPAPPLPPGVNLIPTPGHTDGHTAVHLPNRGALLTGDALVTLDPYTGRRGPQIIAGAATADSRVAISSLQALTNITATVVLPGHGAPWYGYVEDALGQAARYGPH
jgi:glyoxylase-like metal-dependent hydrolase (beta-lactamase superfamily II)